MIDPTMNCAADGAMGSTGIILEYVREEERTTVAREIHDELGQALTAIKIDFSSWVHDLPREPRRSDKAESILKLLDQTIEAVRRISTELRPGILDDLGLVAAVEWAAEEFEARTGTKCRLNLRNVSTGFCATLRNF
jgi:signal transduction histidine kinase